jgi:Tol biopolymer transport system component
MKRIISVDRALANLVFVFLLIVLVTEGCNVPRPQCPPLAYAKQETDPTTFASYYEVFRRDADGCDAVRLTDTPGKDNLGPSWSPDGTKLVFSSDRDAKGEIYVMNANGSGLQRLTHDSNWDSDPDWSPDGTDRIAFTSMRNGHRGIYVMKADGSEVHALSTQDDYQPDWSPDGSRIVFVSDRNNLRRIFVMQDDGSQQSAITDSANNDAPAWSPDGTRIAFDTSVGIWVKEPAASSQATLLVQGGDDPTWSPDSNQIAFVRLEDGRYKLAVMRADGTGVNIRFDVGNTRMTNLAWRPG